MLLAGDLVIVAMMALMVLLLVAGAEALWQRRGRRAMTHEPRPTAGSDLMPAGIHPARRYPVGRQVSGAPGLAHAPRLPRRPAAGGARGATGLTGVRTTKACVRENGRTAAGTRGRGHLRLVPRGYGASSRWRGRRRRGKRRR